MDDDTLIRAAQKGDRQAFQVLLETHYDGILRLALSWCGCAVDADDIAQQVCVKLATQLGNFRFQSAFSTWLYRVVINCAKDWLRSSGRKAAAIDGDADVETEKASADAGESAVHLRQVLQRVESLGDGFKETLILVFAEGMNHAEAASILEIKESTVSWRIHKIRQALQSDSGRCGEYDE